MPRTARPIEIRFWEKVDKNGPLPDQSKSYYLGLGNCWMWMGGKDKDGYGRFNLTHDTWRHAHRVSYSLYSGGPIPDGMKCLHKCDIPGCVRPSHLWIGTTAQNNEDIAIKRRGAIGMKSGRHTRPDRTARGSRHGNAILTEAIVRAIRASSEPGRILAERYGLKNRNTPNLIRSRRSWAHVV